LTNSVKIYSVLFRIFLITFILLYFIPTGIKFHELLLFHVPFDYLGHAFFSFILFALYINTFNPEKVKNNARPFVLRLLILALLVSFFEVIQQFVPTRSFDWFDLLANFTGMVLGTGVGMGVRRSELREKKGYR